MHAMHKENTDRNISIPKSLSKEVEKGKSSEDKIKAGKVMYRIKWVRTLSPSFESILVFFLAA